MVSYVVKKHSIFIEGFENDSVFVVNRKAPETGNTSMQFVRPQFRMILPIFEKIYLLKYLLVQLLIFSFNTLQLSDE